MKDANKNIKIDAALFQRYAEGRCTPEEKALIDSWYIEQKRLSPSFDLEEDMLIQDLQEVKARLQQYTQDNRRPKPKEQRKTWLAIAASVMLLGISVYYFTSQEKNIIPQQRPEIVRSDTLAVPRSHSVRYAKTDVAPARSGAILILSNGEKVNLDERHANNKKIDKNLTIDFSKSGQIAYQGAPSDYSTNEVQTNTIVVPRGRIYDVILADGSRVSLNAESKLTFPVHFNDIKNDLYLEGEAYFEVNKKVSDVQGKRHSREFVVHTGESAVHVLGTKFNIKAYPADKSKSFVLETGSISLLTPSSPTALLIKPGQRASLSNESDLRLEEVDIRKELSWKNGDFYFEDNTLPEMLDQITRWYNVEVQYLGPVNEQRYISTISRNKTLKEVLEILESTTGLTFDIQQKGKERRLMVIP